MKPIIPSQKVLDLWLELEELEIEFSLANRPPYFLRSNMILDDAFEMGLKVAKEAIRLNTKIFKLEGIDTDTFLLFDSEEDLEKAIQSELDVFSGNVKLKSPREENGPDGYPKNNPTFRKAAAKVLADRQDDAEKARDFLHNLRTKLRDES